MGFLCGFDRSVSEREREREKGYRNFFEKSVGYKGKKFKLENEIALKPLILTIFR